jgi:hypothetical protein
MTQEKLNVFLLNAIQCSETCGICEPTDEVVYLSGKHIELSFKDEYRGVPEIDILPISGKFERIEYETHSTDNPDAKWKELSYDGWELVEMTDTFVKVKRVVKPSPSVDGHYKIKEYFLKPVDLSNVGVEYGNDALMLIIDQWQNKNID